MLENSLNDAQIVYSSLKTYLNTLEGQFNDKQLLSKWNDEIEATINSLLNGDFNTFDRYHFVKNHIQHQLKLWNETVADWNTEFPFELELTNNASSFFQ